MLPSNAELNHSLESPATRRKYENEDIGELESLILRRNVQHGQNKPSSHTDNKMHKTK